MKTIKIKEVKYLDNYNLLIEYKDGQKGTLNLENDIKKFVKDYNKFHEMLKREYFMKVRLNKTWNTIEWPNGFDISPELLQPNNSKNLSI